MMRRSFALRVGAAFSQSPLMRCDEAAAEADPAAEEGGERKKKKKKPVRVKTTLTPVEEEAPPPPPPDAPPAPDVITNINVQTWRHRNVANFVNRGVQKEEPKSPQFSLAPKGADGKKEAPIRQVMWVAHNRSKNSNPANVPIAIDTSNRPRRPKPIPEELLEQHAERQEQVSKRDAEAQRRLELLMARAREDGVVSPQDIGNILRSFSFLDPRRQEYFQTVEARLLLDGALTRLIDGLNEGKLETEPVAMNASISKLYEFLSAPVLRFGGAPQDRTLDFLDDVLGIQRAVLDYGPRLHQLCLGGVLASFTSHIMTNPTGVSEYGEHPESMQPDEFIPAMLNAWIEAAKRDVAEQEFEDVARGWVRVVRALRTAASAQKMKGYSLNQIPLETLTEYVDQACSVFIPMHDMIDTEKKGLRAIIEHADGFLIEAVTGDQLADAMFTMSELNVIERKDSEGNATSGRACAIAFLGLAAERRTGKAAVSSGLALRRGLAALEKSISELPSKIRISDFWQGALQAVARGIKSHENFQRTTVRANTKAALAAQIAADTPAEDGITDRGLDGGETGNALFTVATAHTMVQTIAKRKAVRMLEIEFPASHVGNTHQHVTDEFAWTMFLRVVRRSFIRYTEDGKLQFAEPLSEAVLEGMCFAVRRLLQRQRNEGKPRNGTLPFHLNALSLINEVSNLPVNDTVASIVREAAEVYLDAQQEAMEKVTVVDDSHLSPLSKSLKLATKAPSEEKELPMATIVNQLADILLPLARAHLDPKRGTDLRHLLDPRIVTVILERLNRAATSANEGYGQCPTPGSFAIAVASLAKLGVTGEECGPFLRLIKKFPTPHPRIKVSAEDDDIRQYLGLGELRSIVFAMKKMDVADLSVMAHLVTLHGMASFEHRRQSHLKDFPLLQKPSSHWSSEFPIGLMHLEHFYALKKMIEKVDKKGGESMMSRLRFLREDGVEEPLRPKPPRKPKEKVDAEEEGEEGGGGAEGGEEQQQQQQQDEGNEAMNQMDGGEEGEGEQPQTA